MSKAIKEIIIMLLICFITMLILAIGLYKFIPSKKIIPETTKYQVSEEVQILLDDDVESRKDEKEVLLTYEVTQNDLNNYEKANIYVPGKANPFAAYASTPSGEEQQETPNIDETNSSVNKDSNTNTTKNEPKTYYNTTGTK